MVSWRFQARGPEWPAFAASAAPFHPLAAGRTSQSQSSAWPQRLPLVAAGQATPSREPHIHCFPRSPSDLTLDVPAVWLSAHIRFHCSSLATGTKKHPPCLPVACFNFTHPRRPSHHPKPIHPSHAVATIPLFNTQHAPSFIHARYCAGHSRPSDTIVHTRLLPVHYRL